MNLGGILSFRYSKEEIDSWTSLKKSSYILLPLLVYLLVHDLVEVLLWACIDQVIVTGAGSITALLVNNVATVQGLVNGLMILAGVAAIFKAVKSEILWVEQYGTGKEGLQGENLLQGTPRTDEKRTAEKVTEKKVTAYILVAVLALCSAFALNLLFHLLGITEASQAFDRAVNAQYGVDFAVGLFLYGIVSPMAEEAVFRGVMYNRMKRCFGYWPALLLSSFLFGAYHGNFVQAIYGTLLGILIAYVYERYESFAAPVLFHAVANVSVYVMTYHGSFVNMEKKLIIAAAVITVAASAACIFIMKRSKQET